MAKRLKRAFTITELVIVIAVVAILAAVLIPTFSNIIKKADESADTQLVKNLNTILSSEQTVSQEAAPTMSKALEQAQEGGYTVDKLTPTSDGDILWEQDSNRFVLVSGGEIIFKDSTTTASIQDEPYKFWKITNEDGEIKNNAAGYSYYLGNKYSGGSSLTVTAGLDVGEQAIEKITYATEKEQTVVFNTTGGTLEIDAPNSDVKHYGSAKMVDVKEVKGQSYHLYGTITDTLKVTAGHIYIEAPGAVNVLDGTAVTEESGKATATIDMSSSATVGTVVIAKDVAEAALGTALKGAVEGGAVDTVEEIPEEASLFAGGIGTEKSPFLIETAVQFAAIGQLSEEMFQKPYYFRLTDDIYLNEVEASLPVCSWGTKTVTNYFTGVLDGDGHSIFSGNNENIQLAVSNPGNATFRDLTIVQHGGQGSFVFVVYGNGYINSNGGLSILRNSVLAFENILVTGQTANTLVEYGTNGSAFVSQAASNVNFIDCTNSVNLSMTAYAGIFLGGYAFAIEDNGAMPRFTYKNCVNTAEVTGVTVGFFTGNANQAKFALVSSESALKSATCDDYEAVAYVENCANNGTMVGVVSCGQFSRGNNVLISDHNALANDALNETNANGTSRFSKGGIFFEGNYIADSGLTVTEQGNEQSVQITPSESDQIVTYNLETYVSISYKDTAGEAAGSSYFTISTSVSADEVGAWRMPFVSKVISSADYKTATDTDYTNIAAEEKIDSRNHKYKEVKQDDGSIWLVVEYNSLLNDGMLPGGAGTVTVGAEPNYRLNLFTATNSMYASFSFTAKNIPQA